MKEGFCTFLFKAANGAVNAALRYAKCLYDFAGPAVARVDQLRDGQPEHPQIVMGVRVDRMAADEVRPALLVAPHAENLVNGRCALRHKW